MKIYTRTGDAGETGLFAGGRVPKDHVRVEAYGEVDELNSVLGWAIVELARGDAQMATRLRRLQDDLFAIGAHLATPTAVDGGSGSGHLPPLPTGRIDEMERWMDAADETLPQLREFILPGGTEGAARLHITRAVCRRAERRVVTLSAVEPVDPTVIRYLNRLSDLLFTFARVANARAGEGDVKWERERAEDEG